MNPVFRLFTHSTLLALMWDNPTTMEHCSTNQTDPKFTFMLALYTAWIGFELGTTVTQKADMRKDILFHHIFTVIAVIISWKMQIACSAYATVRATMLCEPFVNLYFIFKDTKPVNIVTDTLMFITFPYTRVVLMFGTVVKPIVFNNVLDFNPATMVAMFFGVMLYGLQCMWSWKIIKGGISRLV